MPVVSFSPSFLSSVFSSLLLFHLFSLPLSLLALLFSTFHIFFNRLSSLNSSTVSEIDIFFFFKLLEAYPVSPFPLRVSARLSPCNFFTFLPVRISCFSLIFFFLCLHFSRNRALVSLNLGFAARPLLCPLVERNSSWQTAFTRPHSLRKRIRSSSIVEQILASGF